MLNIKWFTGYKSRLSHLFKCTSIFPMYSNHGYKLSPEAKAIDYHIERLTCLRRKKIYILLHDFYFQKFTLEFSLHLNFTCPSNIIIFCCYWITCIKHYILCFCYLQHSYFTSWSQFHRSKLILKLYMLIREVFSRSRESELECR